MKLSVAPCLFQNLYGFNMHSWAIIISYTQIDAQEWGALKTAHRRWAEYRVKLGADNGALVFDPPVLSIRVGDQVTFVNNAGFPHNVVLDEDRLPDGAYNSYSYHTGALTHEDYLNAPGESFTAKFDLPGVYHYYCEPHQGAGMTAQVIVNA
jgi:plastocyanin